MGMSSSSKCKRKPCDTDAVASSFINSPEYKGHPLVQQHRPASETIIPISFYSDGISVASNPRSDTLYVIYLSFMHRDMDECAHPSQKHVFTFGNLYEALDDATNCKAPKGAKQ